MIEALFIADLGDLEEFLKGDKLRVDIYNVMYVTQIKHQSVVNLIPALKLLSPYCENIENIPFEINGEEYFDAVKFILQDKKYANYDWISGYLGYDTGTVVNKTEILRFILDGNFDANLIHSIMFVVIVYNYFYDVDVLLELIDKIDVKVLNQKDAIGGTVIHKMLAENHFNSAAIMEKAISNGYDVNIPFVYAKRRGIKKTTTIVPTLTFFFQEIHFGFLAEDESKQISYLLIKHSALNKKVIDGLIKFFDSKAEKSGFDINFFKYIDIVCGDHSDFPTFFFENYPNEVAKNDCHNLLPKEVKDIFVF